VSWNNYIRKYFAEIWVNGHGWHLGYFDNPAEAAWAYARAYLRQHGGPSASSLAEPLRQKEEGKEAIDLAPFRSTNNAGYQGVSWNSSSRNYTASITVDSVRRHLGYFDTAEEAAQAYARAYLTQNGRPPAGSSASRVADKFRQKEEGKEAIDLELFRSTNNAGYQGVSLKSSSRKYHAEIRLNGGRRYLGGFDTAEEAAQAYASAYLRQNGRPPAAALKMKIPNPRKRQRNDCLPEEAPPPASIKRKTDPKKEEGGTTRSNVIQAGERLEVEHDEMQLA